jgi:hypothetical protein
MGDRVNLYMASLPERIGTLKKSLLSLAGQVDTVQIAITYPVTYLQEEFNGPYVRMVDEVNTIMGKPLTILHHDNSLKDGSRFIGAHKKPGYCMVCDDDIEYPPDFVNSMIATYNSTPMGFLTVMGKNLKPRPLQSYYKGWAENYKTFSEVKELTRVDIPGCCGILWHTDIVQVNETDMNVPNSDVCVGVLAKQRGLLSYVIPHTSTWLKNLMPELPKNTLDIYKTYKNNDKLQTDYINRWM